MTTDIYTTCSGKYLIGGYGVLGIATTNSGDYFWRSYGGLPAHSYIRYTFTIFALDTWDQNGSDGTPHNDAFQVAFDGLTVYGQSYAGGSWTMFTPLCGGIWNDVPNIRVQGIVPHMGTSLNIKFISDLNEVSTNESFGFRDLILLFDQNPPPYPETASMCGYQPSITFNSNNCECPTGQYKSASVCVTCPAACTACYGGTPRHCFSCASGYSWDGYSCTSCDNSYTDLCSFPSATTKASIKCKGTNYVLSGTTGQCYFDCKYPWTKSAATVPCYSDECTVTCSVNQYTYWDKSCEATCPFPLQSLQMLDVSPLCIYPCGSGDFLYWDGTCYHDCPRPFTTTVTKGKYLCTTTCSATQYIYPDGSCQAACPSPLFSETIQGRKLCKSPCNTPGESLYANGECSICDPLFTSSTTLGIQYCTSACPNYLYWNTTCLATCPRPLSIRIEKKIRNIVIIQHQRPTSFIGMVRIQQIASVLCHRE